MLQSFFQWTKMYFQCFKTLCHMDYFDDVFILYEQGQYPVHTFSMEGQKTLGLNLKYLKTVF